MAEGPTLEQAKAAAVAACQPIGRFSRECLEARVEELGAEETMRRLEEDPDA